MDSAGDSPDVGTWGESCSKRSLRLERRHTLVAVGTAKTNMKFEPMKEAVWELRYKQKDTLK